MPELKTKSRPERGGMKTLCQSIGLALAMALVGPVAEAGPINMGAGLWVVDNDRGGMITTRLKELRMLRNRASRVEIRGKMCMSSCTMFLGLPQTCVSPDTSFGFHGPSVFGLPMGTADFDNTSRVIAANYPAPLREWYMSEARYKLMSFTRVSGANLIELGVPQCPTAG